MATSEDKNRMAALRGFERLLVARGLGLEDVAKAILALPKARKRQRGRSAFERMFDDVVGDQGDDEPQRRTTSPKVEDLPIRSGDAIPAVVQGYVRLVEDDGSRDAEMKVATLAFNVVSQNAVYGPILAYAGAYMNKLEEAVRHARTVALVIGQPNRGRKHPYLIRFTR